MSPVRDIEAKEIGGVSVEWCPSRRAGGKDAVVDEEVLAAMRDQGGKALD